MQNEQYTADTDHAAIEQAQPTGPVLLQPEMLAWISGGGGGGKEELPKGTW